MSPPPNAGDHRLRRERRVVIGTLTGISVQLPVFVLLQDFLGGQAGPVGVTVAAVLATVVAAMLLRMMLRRTLCPGERPLGLFLPSLVLLAVAMWILLPGAGALLMAATWWGTVALAVPRGWSAGAGAVLLGLAWLHMALTGDSGPLSPPFTTLLAIGLAWGVLFGNTVNLRLWDLSREVVAGQRARARLAAGEERLRIARDIHDLLGHSLSGIAVRSELAARLTEIDPGRAAGEMFTVQDEARRALREVRSTVSGYRDADLAEELEGAREVLNASGTRLTVRGEIDEVPEHLRSVAAWVVREGATNVVRHSTARHCDVLLDQSDTSLDLRIRNDGAVPDAGEGRGGSGILGLTHRVVAAGGTLTAGPEGEGGFLLRVVLPTRNGRPGKEEET